MVRKEDSLLKRKMRQTAEGEKIQRQGASWMKRYVYCGVGRVG